MCKTAVISNRVVRLCRVFGGQLVILIQTIKQLYETCKKQTRITAGLFFSQGL
jgi:hypothetical protein